MLRCANHFRAPPRETRSAITKLTTEQASKSHGKKNNREDTMLATPTMHRSIAGSLPCAQCGTALKRPVWSEPVDERQLRHLWNCRDCGYVFETLVFYCAEETAEPADMAAPPLAA
jgi:hypothetical protein